MGVPVMKLYLVQVPLDGRRWYFKNPTEAKKQQKALKPAATTRTEVMVTLTKDGVLEALNQVPFRGRVPEATVRVPQSNTGAGTSESGGWSVTPPPAAPQPLTKAQRDRLAHLYRVDREDRAALRGKDREYIKGWNRVKDRRVY